METITNHKKQFFGNIEIKIILDFIIKIFKIKNYKSKIILLTGISENGKTFSLIKLSLILGKNIPFIFSNGLSFISPNKICTNLLNKLARKSVGIKFYQENFIVKGKLSSLEIKDFKLSSYCMYARITLKRETSEKMYDISEELLKKIIKKQIKLGDIITINRTTGDIYSEKFIDLKCFYNDYGTYNQSIRNSFEKIVVTEQVVTLEELDNVNENENFLRKYFSTQFDSYRNKKKKELDGILAKWVKNYKIKLTRGILALDDVHLLNDVNFSFLKNLLQKFTSPIILCCGLAYFKYKELTLLSSSHLFPLDFLNSCVVSTFRPTCCKEIFEIIKCTCCRLNLSIKKGAVSLLVKVGLECGLKYSIYLLSISSVLKKTKFLKIGDIKQSYNLFFNFGRCITFTKFQHFKSFYPPNL